MTQMVTISATKQHGWTVMGMLVVMGAAAAGALLFAYVFQSIEARQAIPWYVCTLMLIPVGFGLTAINKLNELHADREGMTRDEKRRLEGIVDEKLRQIYLAISFYVLAAIVSLGVVLIGKEVPGALAWGVPVIGGFLFICIVSIGFLLAQIAEVSKFVGHLKDRKDRRKQKRKLRARTGTKLADQARH
ncbi:hypothetical protein MLC59_01970 [Marinobacter bryozoorum]|uniref:hypothetical protein n=1 Tax=Marinobacter bryozoorum TaxID=256324 RepID=UPI002004A851|nr:hypothetical protein [Marinobacter bryozoorum]MCK7542937.1 hypothetical protein [Marinobacter bryozoorum]